MARKKRRKQVTDLVEESMMMSAGSVALGAVGGTAATHGQAGISGMSGFQPVRGRMMGVGMVMDSLKGLEPKKRKRRK